jgi:hypothetical protein
MNLIGSIFDADTLLPIMIFAIPIVAIVGGITAGIVKTITDSKMIENTQRERLAALHRGVDLDRRDGLEELELARLLVDLGDVDALGLLLTRASRGIARIGADIGVVGDLGRFRLLASYRPQRHERSARRP